MHPTSPSATRRRSRDPLAYSAGDCTVIAAHGRIDSAGFLALERLASVAIAGGCSRLVFDLYEVSDIDPEALGLLRAALRGNRLGGATLALAGVRPSVALALKEVDSEGMSIHSNLRAAMVPAHAGAGR